MSNCQAANKPRCNSREIPSPPLPPGQLKPIVKEANEEARRNGYKYAVMMTEDAHLFCCYCGAVSGKKTTSTSMCT